MANHGSSVHHACFLSNTQFCTLSHDEDFSIYQLDDQGDDSKSLLTKAFGDLRPRLECEYVVDVLPSLGDDSAIVGAGWHSKQQLDIVALRRTGTEWEFDPHDIIRLGGAHGEAIIRSMYLDRDANSILTAGEDGDIKVWRTSGEDEFDATRTTEIKSGLSKKMNRRDSISNAERKGRFKPY